MESQELGTETQMRTAFTGLIFDELLAEAACQQSGEGLSDWISAVFISGSPPR